jgi:WD40 repeat protein
MIFRLMGSLSLLLLAVAASERSTVASEKTDPKPERILFSPAKNGRLSLCNLQFTPDGKYLLARGVGDGLTVVSTADWSTRPLTSVDAPYRVQRFLTTCLPCVAIVLGEANGTTGARRLLAIDLSATNRSPVDLGEFEGHLVRWGAGRRTDTLAVIERFDERDSRNSSMRLSLVHSATGDRDVVHEVADVRAVHNRQHFVDFMNEDRYLVWITADAVGVWDVAKRTKVAEADLVGRPCNLDFSHRRALGLSASTTGSTFWICARQGGLFEGKLEDDRILLESVPGRAQLAQQRQAKPTFRGPHGSLGAHGSSVPSLRYHRAFPWNDDRWIIAKTHSYAVFGPSDFSVKVIDLATGKQLVSLPSRGTYEPFGSSIATSDTADLLAIQLPDGTVGIWRQEEIERYLSE